MTALLPVSVMLPLLGAGLTLVARRAAGVQRVISVLALAVQLVTECAMLIGIDASGPIVMHLGGWAAPVGIALVADRFAAILMVVSTVVTLGVLVYAISQETAGHPGWFGRGSSAPAFHPAMLIMATGVSNAFVAGDLFNLFVSFEILLTASYVLLTVGGTAERMRAGTSYLVVSLLSSLIFLAAIALVYSATGTVNLADLAGRLADLPRGLVSVLQALLLVAFGIKAAVWPMSAWLPDSYPNAPAPVTAVFAGLLTKVGIYAIIRVQTLLFGGQGFVTLLMWAALATMLVGILGAVAQGDIKRMLSFTLVSHIGYLLFGVAIGGHAGLAATVYYVVHHILVQTALFLAAGLIEQLAGTTSVSRLGGLATRAPLLAVLFFIPAMNLGGVPPLSGFLGKIGLFQAGLAAGGALPAVVVAAGTVTSLLTLYAIVRIWGRAFWRPAPQDGDAEEAPDAAPGAGGDGDTAPAANGDAMPAAVPAVGGDGIAAATPRRAAGGGPAPAPVASRVRLPGGMLAATAAVVLVGVALTAAAGPLYGLAGRAADDLGHPARYVTAVLGQP
ncbi:MAG TPA: Na+/H+ antiporter subunit D [Nakamurella sp.]|jgi:multicomponent Na+:H+ antiporter subunit D|nr:Na+/H+ antiporter subunit D [Nakamurella sp.]